MWNHTGFSTGFRLSPERIGKDCEPWDLAHDEKAWDGPVGGETDVREDQEPSPLSVARAQTTGLNKGKVAVPLGRSLSQVQAAIGRGRATASPPLSLRDDGLRWPWASSSSNASQYQLSEITSARSAISSPEAMELGGINGVGVAEALAPAGPRVHQSSGFLQQPAGASDSVTWRHLARRRLLVTASLL